MQPAAGRLPVVLVGGGAHRVPDAALPGCDVVRPEHGDVAGAFGAAASRWAAPASGSCAGPTRWTPYGTRVRELARSQCRAGRRPIPGGCAPCSIPRSTCRTCRVRYSCGPRASGPPAPCKPDRSPRSLQLPLATRWFRRHARRAPCPVPIPSRTVPHDELDDGARPGARDRTRRRHGTRLPARTGPDVRPLLLVQRGRAAPRPALRPHPDSCSARRWARAVAPARSERCHARFGDPGGSSALSSSASPACARACRRRCWCAGPASAVGRRVIGLWSSRCHRGPGFGVQTAVFARSIAPSRVSLRKAVARVCGSVTLLGAARPGDGLDAVRHVAARHHLRCVSRVAAVDRVDRGTASPAGRPGAVRRAHLRISTRAPRIVAGSVAPGGHDARHDALTTRSDRRRRQA